MGFKNSPRARQIGRVLANRGERRGRGAGVPVFAQHSCAQ